jgi:hypothetical protein
VGYDEYEPPSEFALLLESMAPNLEHVFFVPTKYRVYYEHLGQDGSIPNAQWEALQRLCAASDLRCTDLTPALVERTNALLAAGELTFWRDDTHWNGQGTAAAADVVAQVLTVEAVVR